MQLYLPRLAAFAALAAAGLAGPASADAVHPNIRHDDQRQESRRDDKRDDESLVLRNKYGRSVVFRVLVEDERGDVRLRSLRGTLSNRVLTGPVRSGDRVVVELESVARGRRASTARIHVVVEDARRPGRRLDHFHRDVRVDDRNGHDHDHGHGHGHADNDGPWRSDDRDRGTDRGSDRGDDAWDRRGGR